MDSGLILVGERPHSTRLRKEESLVSEDVDKICRAILYSLKTAKSLEDAIDAVEVIAGAENVAVVNDKIAKKTKCG